MKLYYIEASQYVKIPKIGALIYSITRRETSTLELCFLTPKEYFKAQYYGYFKTIFIFSNKLCQPKHSKSLLLGMWE